MSFDTLAPWYRAMELLLAGPLLQRCRLAHLPRLSNCRRALLLGEGPGRFLVPLLRANPEIRATCVERSPRMVEIARRQVQRAGLDPARVIFQTRDVWDWTPPPAAFDLIATHFFLDCFQPDELARLVPKLARCASREAVWLVSDFHQPGRGWQKWRAKTILALMHAFFRHAAGISARRLAPPDSLLQAERFFSSDQTLLNHGLLHSTLWRRGAGVVRMGGLPARGSGGR